MTLNLMLTSRSSGYLSGDFRLTYRRGEWEDNLDTQKLIPIFTYGWSALVSFAGVAQTSSGLDVGEWVSQQLAGIEMDAKFVEISRRLLTADKWLSKVSGYRPLVFSVVGFIGKRPVAMVISNYSDINGQLFDPLLPRLKKFESRPKESELRVAGDRKGVRKEDIGELKKMLRENRSPREIEAGMAKINASASDKSSTISRECVTGHLLPTGRAEVRPHGIGNRVEYLPGFVKRNFLHHGISTFKCRVDEKGNPLPPRWVGMTAKRVQGPRRKDQGVLATHAVRNVEEPIAGKPSPRGGQVFWNVAGKMNPCGTASK